MMVGALALQACSDAADTPALAPVRTVLASRAEPATAAANMVVGTVRSAQTHIVSAEQGGRVVVLLADVGDRVAAGQVLARLDTVPLDLRVSAAMAEAARAAATAAERARNAERVAQLVADGTASAAELDTARAEAATARAAKSLADVQASQARRDKTLALLRAPSAGVVAARPAMLSAMLAPGAPAFEIEGEGDRLISAALPADVAARLRQGARISFQHDGITGTARLAGISTRDNGTGGRDASFVVIAGAPAPGAIVELLLPAALQTASARVPQSAVLEGRDGRQTIRVVGADNRLHDVPVQLLGLAGASALVRGRLAAGDLVVAAGGEFLQAGMRVRPHVAVR
ncbi:hypothetical protein IP88_03695 [alpha proteobacterium AAP81b]|nr:hypothetical protein IP88_03695 [alpha proteobacterium AAP81b]